VVGNGLNPKANGCARHKLKMSSRKVGVTSYRRPALKSDKMNQDRFAK
jgi:hypothetical protein